MYKIIFFFIVLLPAICCAQITISGKILNRADAKSIANASVFLRNSSIGTNTVNDGTFILHNIKPGKYELVVSIVGFDSYSQTITVENSNLQLSTISLSPKTIILNEVSIKPITGPYRDRNYQWFKNEFLGTSIFADDCKILNPEVLDIAYSDSSKSLTASSVDFLQIENDGLGYKIKYLLTDFVKDSRNENAQKIRFTGSALFEEMKGTPLQEKRWQKKRLEVYEGSIMHFLRSSLNNTFDAEGFRVLRVISIFNPQRPPDSIIAAKIKLYQSLKGGNRKYRDTLAYWQQKWMLPKTFQKVEHIPLKQADFIKLTDQKGVYALTSNTGALLIIFNNKRHFSQIDKPEDVDDPGNTNKTLINFNAPYALFDKNGGVVDPNSLSFKGAWGKNRLAELLPLDYQPASSLADITPKILAEDISASGLKKNEFLTLKTASNNKQPSEKAYLQFDRPYYALGDTIWFKGYLFNDFLTPSDKSQVINIDITDDGNKVIKQYRFPVWQGLTWGNIGLDEGEFTPGTYTLRAYTSWMRNFGEDGFYYKTFYVSSTTENNLLVHPEFTSSMASGSHVVSGKLLFSTSDNMPYAVKPLSVAVVRGSRTLYREKLQTGIDGSLNLNFKLPEKAFGVKLIAESEEKDKKAVVPVILNRPERADLQFLPEGGSLVAGLPAHIGFKAVGEDGLGMQLSGIVTDHEQKKVAEFTSLHNGMGSFDLAVTAGETYTAKISFADNQNRTFLLPAVKASGTMLRVKNPMSSDSVEVIAAITDDQSKSSQSYFLIGRARGIVCYAAVVDFRNGFIRKKIAKNLFPTGIAHFTLMTAKYEPVNERLVFIDAHDNLDIQFTTDRPHYGSKDSVNLRLKVTDKNGKPVRGNFSLGVTDDAQVKTDSVNGENLINRMLLTADLKGYIEQPGYYFSSKTPEKWTALDNLLLTQGWVGYGWKNVLNPSAITYQPEQDLKVKGRVLNAFNKPVRGTHVLLFSKSPAILMDTTTNNEGAFKFDHFPRVDTPVFVLKAVNKNGKSFNVGITVDEVKPPEFVKPNTPAIMPWYVNIDTTLLNYTKHAALAKQQQYFPGTGHILKEVKISAKKIVKGSQNPNGSGNADLVLDEKDMEKAGKKTWLELLEENVKGFRIATASHPWFFIQDLKPPIVRSPGQIVSNTHEWYFINDKPVKFYIDGTSITETNPTPVWEVFSYTGAFDHITSFLKRTSAENIKGVEVNFTDKYSSAYIAAHVPIDQQLSVHMDDVAFIEITTRSGHGPIIDNTPGMYLYKPLPLSWPKQFYKPKYAVTDTAKHLPNLRATIDWEPNVTTDAKGEAKIWFYTADKPSTYTVIVEGTDLNGGLGYKYGKIKVGESKGKGPGKYDLK